MKQEDINKLNQKLENASAEEILTEVATLFPGKISFASSLGYEDQIIAYFIAKNKLPISIFTLDTGRLFPETYDLIDRTVAKYKINIEVYFPNYQQVEQMVNNKGINLFYESIENRKLCCGIRKTEPLKRALNNLEAWITGLRKEQAITRTHMQAVEWDAMHSLVKVNPLINWSAEQVERFIKSEAIPYNKLHDKGFPSIGCQPCTRAVQPGEDIRAGRWWWEQPEQKECGLHKS